MLSSLHICPPTHTHMTEVFRPLLLQNGPAGGGERVAANALDKQAGERAAHPSPSQRHCPDLQRRVEGREPAPDNINLACYYLQWWKTTVWQSLT